MPRAPMNKLSHLPKRIQSFVRQNKQINLSRDPLARHVKAALIKHFDYEETRHSSGAPLLTKVKKT